MPSRPIHPLPAPRWTAAHTEGLKGLGKGLLQDYQRGMDYLGGLSEHPAVQGLGFLLPMIGGMSAKPQRALASLRSKLPERWHVLDFGGKSIANFASREEALNAFGPPPSLKSIRSGQVYDIVPESRLRLPSTQGSLKPVNQAQSRLTKNASKLASLNPRSGEWAAEQVAEAKQDIAKTRQELKR